MSTKVEIVYSHPHDGNEVGVRKEVEKLEAKRLVRAGVATYANKTEAKKAGAQTAPVKTAARKSAANRRRTTSTPDASQEPSTPPAEQTDPAADGSPGPDADG